MLEIIYTPPHMNTFSPGGLLMFRDYGRFDEAQLRFDKGHLLGDHFYVKGDGTRVYYFTLEDVRRLMTGGSIVKEKEKEDPSSSSSLSSSSSEVVSCNKIGDAKKAEESTSENRNINPTSSNPTSGSSLLEEVELSYIRRQYANRGQQKARFRVWVHAKFRKSA
jgi:tRNAThr (cytosine32-N3)-methyltransferase